jgi:hypothetical protein
VKRGKDLSPLTKEAPWAVQQHRWGFAPAGPSLVLEGGEAILLPVLCPTPLVMVLPGPLSLCHTFFSKSGSLKVKRNLRTCSDRSLSMLLASMARPRNSSTSSSGFALSWAFLGSRGHRHRLTNRGAVVGAGFAWPPGLTREAWQVSTISPDSE